MQCWRSCRWPVAYDTLHQADTVPASQGKDLLAPVALLCITDQYRCMYNRSVFISSRCCTVEVCVCILGMLRKGQPYLHT